MYKRDVVLAKEILSQSSKLSDRDSGIADCGIFTEYDSYEVYKLDRRQVDSLATRKRRKEARTCNTDVDFFQPTVRDELIERIARLYPSISCCLFTTCDDGITRLELLFSSTHKGTLPTCIEVSRKLKVGYDLILVDQLVDESAVETTSDIPGSALLTGCGSAGFLAHVEGDIDGKPLLLTSGHGKTKGMSIYTEEPLMKMGEVDQVFQVGNSQSIPPHPTCDVAVVKVSKKIRNIEDKFNVVVDATNNKRYLSNDICPNFGEVNVRGRQEDQINLMKLINIRVEKFQRGAGRCVGKTSLYTNFRQPNYHECLAISVLRAAELDPWFHKPGESGTMVTTLPDGENKVIPLAMLLGRCRLRRAGSSVDSHLSIAQPVYNVLTVLKNETRYRSLSIATPNTRNVCLSVDRVSLSLGIALFASAIFVIFAVVIMY